VAAIIRQAFVKELATAIMVLGVTAAALALPIARQEAAAELGAMLAAVEGRAKVLAWLDPCPSSSYLGQVLHDTIMRSSLPLAGSVFCGDYVDINMNKIISRNDLV
jgi:hypothetical protein